MRIMADLNAAGAVIRGRHFVYTHGQHGPDYVRIDALLSEENLDLLDRICGELVIPFMDSGVEAVTACKEDRCSALARLSAEHLGVKPASGDLLRGKRTLIVEDALTTGLGVIGIREDSEANGAFIVGASVIVNRARITAEILGVPRLEVLADVPLLAFQSDQCGLCLDEVPIVADEGIGSGARFLELHPEYPGGFEKIIS